MVDLAGYGICALIRPKGVLWDLDRDSEKASLVLNTHFVKPRLCKPLCVNGAVILLEEKWAFPEILPLSWECSIAYRMSTYISEFMFPIPGKNEPKSNHEKHPHTIMLPPPNLTVSPMQSLKKRSSGIRQTKTHSNSTARH
ncbi:hypothetical protein TNCV_4629691 [Trichonephila clavipes]|nr:hypothetical protein TNCV_4629691 [Trichonephila clavipes]